MEVLSEDGLCVAEAFLFKVNVFNILKLIRLGIKNAQKRTV